MHEPYLSFRFSVLSPYNFENGNANVFNGNDNGDLNNDNVNNENGVRPDFHIKNTVKFITNIRYGEIWQHIM